MNSRRILGIHSLSENQIFSYKYGVKKFCESTSLKPIFSQNNKALFVDIGFETKKIDFTNFVIQIDGYITNIQDLQNIFNIDDNDQSIVINKILESGIWEIENYLLGNYAISIFDKQKSKLKIFTDHFGTRPIYFAHKEKSYFLHASEINFLKNISDINFTINEKRIFQYLCQYKESAEETFFKEIFLLKPQHIIEFNNGNFKITSYEHHKKYKFQGNTLDEAKKELFYALKTATIQNSPVDLEDSAVLLSGGLDSSCIYSIIDNEHKNIKSISKNFSCKNGEKLICDETYYQELIHKNSSKHKSISFLNKSPFSKADLWLETFGEPFNLANIYLFDEVYSEAKKNGIKQIIDGVDGDTVISHGYERFKELFKLHSFHNFIYEILRFSKNHNYSEYTNKSLFKMFLFPLMRSKKLFQPLFFLRDLFKKKSIPRRRIVKKDVLDEIGFEEPYNINRNFRSHANKLKNPLISIAFINLNILLFKYNVNQHSPFFDKRVVDLCCSFPSKFKLNHGKSRFILRETFANFLPKEIINRYSKANLTHNFVENITENDLKDIENEINNIHPLIKNKISKENLLEEFKLLKLKTLSSMTIMNIWNFYLVNRWLRKNS